MTGVAPHSDSVARTSALGTARDDLVCFSVIVPARGRRSLVGTLASIAEQLEPGDELLVRCSQDGDFGNAARQSLLQRANGTHLLFMDDDDQFSKDAFAVIRRFAREHPRQIGIFRMRLLNGRVMWREPELRRTNVSTQMFCVPNIPDKLGSWMSSSDFTSKQSRPYVADFDFIAETAGLQGEPVFREEVVAHIRADRRLTVRYFQRIASVVAAIHRRLRRFLTRESIRSRM